MAEPDRETTALSASTRSRVANGRNAATVLSVSPPSAIRIISKPRGVGAALLCSLDATAADRLATFSGSLELSSRGGAEPMKDGERSRMERTASLQIGQP